MKTVIFILVLLGTVALAACNMQHEYINETTHANIHQAIHPSTTENGGSSSPYRLQASFDRFTFEELLARDSVTDVAVVRFVGQRPFGRMSTEFEFVVTEWILGGIDAERIFAYWSEIDISIFGPVHFNEGDEYLLPLHRETRAYTPRHIDSFDFIVGTVVNLTNPPSSTMYNRPLYDNATGIDFSRPLPRRTIINYVRSLVQNKEPVVDIIRSDAVEDIVLGSPNILVVQISAVDQLGDEEWAEDFSFHDIFYVTVVDVLAGDVAVGEVLNIAFHANTVVVGEKHVVAVRQVEWFFRFTSRNSLFPMEDLPEILAILNPPQSVTITAEGTGDRLLPGNTLQLSATVYPAVACQNITWAVTGHPQASISETGLLTVSHTILGNVVLTVIATAAGTEIYATADITIIAPTEEEGFRWWSGGLGRTAVNNETNDETNDTTTEQAHRLQLIFTINETIFLLNGDHRTAVGAPFLEGARTMVPLRTIAESTGAGVEWCDDTQAAIIHLYRSPLYASGIHQPTLTIPISAPLPNNMGSVMLINARTFVPLRFIMEAMDADVEWLDETEQAIITWN